MTKPLILAIEPDARQAGQLQAIARRLAADMQLVKSAERALATFDNRIPDLILTPALLSRRDELALTDRLRSLGEVGAHIQTLTIPILETSEAPARGIGMLSALRREKPRVAGPAACEVDTFAEQVSIYLERAVTIRSVKELGASAARDPEPAFDASPASEPEPQLEAPAAPDPEPELEASATPDPGSSAPAVAEPFAPETDDSQGTAAADEWLAPYDEPVPVAESTYDPLAVLSAEPVPVAASVDDVPLPSELSPAHAIVVTEAPAPVVLSDAPAAPRQIERVRVEALPVPHPVIDGPEPDMLMTIRQLKSTLTAPRDTYAPSSAREPDPGPRLERLVEPELPVLEHAPDPANMNGFDAATDGLTAYFADAAAFAAEADVVELSPVAPVDTLGGADALDALGEFATEADIPDIEPGHAESQALPSILVSGPFDSTIAASDLPFLFASEEPSGEQPRETAAPPEKPRHEPSSIKAKTKPAIPAGKAARPRKKGAGGEWRYFDPTEFRFAALIAKLDEITTDKR